MTAARPLLALCLLLAALPGCALAPLDAARLSLGAAVAAWDVALPALEARRAAEGAVCLAPATPPAEAEPCLVAVRARWAPIRAESERVYAALAAAYAMIKLAEAGSTGLDIEGAVSRAVDAVGALIATVAP